MFTFHNRSNINVPASASYIVSSRSLSPSKNASPSAAPVSLSSDAASTSAAVVAATSDESSTSTTTTTTTTTTTNSSTSSSTAGSVYAASGTSTSSMATNSGNGTGSGGWRFEPVHFHNNSSQPLGKKELMKNFIEERQLLTNSKAYVSHWMIDPRGNKENKSGRGRTNSTASPATKRSQKQHNRGHSKLPSTANTKGPIQETRKNSTSAPLRRTASSDAQLTQNSGKSTSTRYSPYAQAEVLPPHDTFSQLDEPTVKQDYTPLSSTSGKSYQAPGRESNQTQYAQEGRDANIWPLIYREMFESLVGADEMKRIDQSYVQSVQRRREGSIKISSSNNLPCSEHPLVDNKRSAITIAELCQD